MKPAKERYSRRAAKRALKVLRLSKPHRTRKIKTQPPRCDWPACGGRRQDGSAFCRRHRHGIDHKEES